jgi:hypothetical protein
MSRRDITHQEQLLSLIDSVRQQLGPAEMQQISQQLGVDQATAEQAVQSALPSMLAGMAGNSQQPEGSTAIQSALGAGGMLGGLGSILGGAGGGGGDLGGMLGSILGRHTDDVHNDVQQTSGLDSNKTRKLLMILAPIVIAALAKRHSQAQAQHPTPGTQPKLDDVLRNEAQRANPSNGGGLLGKILAHVQEPRA